MDLERLATVIEALKARIERRRPALGENEIRTRMALVDPLLQALGWDTTDPAIVMPEYNVAGTGKRADYALIDAAEKPVAVIEAKKLGEELASHLPQMVNYANMAGIPYAALTDGNQWEMYDVFRLGALHDRRILNVSIIGGRSYTLALELLLLWRANMAEGPPVNAGTPVAVPDAEPMSPPSVPPSSAAAVTQEASDTAEQVGEWISLSSFNADDHDLPPAQIKYRDGTIRPITSWRDLLTETASWLWDKEYLKEKDLPVAYTGKTYICHTDSVHPTKRKFSVPKRIVRTPPIYCEAAFPSKDAGVKRLKALLEKCRQSIDAVFVLPHSS